MEKSEQISKEFIDQFGWFGGLKVLRTRIEELLKESEKNDSLKDQLKYNAILKVFDATIDIARAIKF